MTQSFHKQILARAIVALAVAAEPIWATGALGDTAIVTPDQYKPYEFLIGSWEFGQPGKPSNGIMDFNWGPNRSYIKYAARTRDAQGTLTPHFEGIIVWNGLHENLDTLVMLDMQKGRSQEAGTFTIQPDGSVLREIFATASKTSIGPAVVRHFRNVFTPEGHTIHLSLRHETKDGGWEPNFPGSDNLAMTRVK